jgi:hypothetical protein
VSDNLFHSYSNSKAHKSFVLDIVDNSYQPGRYLMMEEIEEIFKLALIKDQRLVTAISFTDLYIYMLAVYYYLLGINSHYKPTESGPNGQG